VAEVPTPEESGIAELQHYLSRNLSDYLMQLLNVPWGKKRKKCFN